MLVQDNVNPHRPASRFEAFPPAGALRFAIRKPVASLSLAAPATLMAPQQSHGLRHWHEIARGRDGTGAWLMPSTPVVCRTLVARF